MTLVMCKNDNFCTKYEVIVLDPSPTFDDMFWVITTFDLRIFPNLQLTLKLLTMTEITILVS